MAGRNRLQSIFFRFFVRRQLTSCLLKDPSAPLPPPLPPTFLSTTHQPPGTLKALDIMGINNLLPNLPGGRSCSFRHSFYGLGMSGDVVPLDAAGALWQFAASNAHDFLRGNYKPSLREWVRFLHYHRSICKWRLVVYFDGRENPDKSFETQRRQVTAANALDPPGLA